MCLELNQSIPSQKLMMKDAKGSCEIEIGEKFDFEVECEDDPQQSHLPLSYVS
jgi:hypothetical protein